MPYVSAKRSGPLARGAHKRHLRKPREIHFPKTRLTKRGLRTQSADHVEDCFDLCQEQGFHLDPDIKIGNDVDASGTLT